MILTPTTPTQTHPIYPSLNAALFTVPMSPRSFIQRSKANKEEQKKKKKKKSKKKKKKQAKSERSIFDSQRTWDESITDSSYDFTDHNDDDENENFEYTDYDSNTNKSSLSTYAYSDDEYSYNSDIESNLDDADYTERTDRTYPQMTSKTKKKKQNTIRGKDGTEWVVDDDGNKIKKVRKKVRRRASLGATDHEIPSSSGEFATEVSVGDLLRGREDSSKKMMSFRTEATELSSSHDSAHQQSKSEPFRSPKAKSPKKKKKNKNIQEIDGEMWRLDDDGMPLNKVRKKSAKGGAAGAGMDRLSQTEHAPSVHYSPKETPSKKKKKKMSLHKSKSVRHVPKGGYESESSSEPLGGAETVNTTGTGSHHPFHDKPRRPKSLADMQRPMGPSRTSSGDLDILMSQSVHEHIRRVPMTEKPKLGRTNSTLGKVGKMLGKSAKKLGKSGAKALSLHSGKPSKGAVDRDSSQKSRSQSDHHSSSTRDDTLKSLQDYARKNKPLPMDIKEIDGVLWRVDSYGNKLNKVRRKSGSDLQHASSRSGWSSGDEGPPDSYSYRNTQWSSDASMSGDSFAGSGAGTSGHLRRHPRQRRRNSMGSQGAGSRCSGPSFTSSRQDSDTSLYLNDIDMDPKNAPVKPRSKSMDHVNLDLSGHHRTYTAPVNPLRQNNSNNSNNNNNSNRDRRSSADNHTVVQNLQHRLRNSEKEIARLCRVTMDQQDKMDENKTDLRKMRDKLKNANRDKQSLVIEIDQLKLEIQRKNDALYDRRTRKPSSSNSLSGGSGHGSDRLVAQVCDLEKEKESLEKKLDAERAQSRNRIEAKEEEVRFLQEELERMRSEQGDKQFEYMQKMASMSDDDDSLYSGSKSAGSRSMDRGKSLQFVGKILGNHLKDKAETEVALQAQEIKDLQDRVYSLQSSNEKLKAELKRATLEIKDDDDDEIRAAKEAAAAASMVAQKHHPGNDLKAKVMSLSRIHRSQSAGEQAMSASFRHNRSSSIGSLDQGSVAQSFRQTRTYR